MDLFGSIEKLITEHGSSAILKERIALLKDKFDAMKSEHDRVADENERLRADIASLTRRLAAIPSPDFLTIRGLLWKPEHDTFEPNPYCPKCRTLMEDFPPGAKMHWCCSGCQFSANWCEIPSSV